MIIAPTRALIVEDVESWTFTLSRAARRAGVSEVHTCDSPAHVRSALGHVRFDVAVIDIGLDPDDDRNRGGQDVLAAIREKDGRSTRCILVTGWPGDFLDVQSEMAAKYGVDWAYMKDRYDGPTVVAKLAELLEGASRRRVEQSTPMAQLAASANQMRFEDSLLRSFTVPLRGDVTVLYALASELLDPITPLLARDVTAPMRALGGRSGSAGLYWSRALGAAVIVELSTSASRQEDEIEDVGAGLGGLLDLPHAPELLVQVRRANLRGRVWEVPGVERAIFA